MFLDIVMGRKTQVALTPRAIAVLDDLAQLTGLTRTDLIEAIAQAQVTLQAEASRWSFTLTPTAAHTQVTPLTDGVSSSTEHAATAGLTTSAAAPATASADVTQHHESDHVALESQNAELRAQLTAAQAEIRQLQSQLNAVTAAAPSSLSNDPVSASLRDQLTQLKRAHGEATNRLQQQTAENQRLSRSLAAAQSLATIGERNLNRWQVRTFAR